MIHRKKNRPALQRRDSSTVSLVSSLFLGNLLRSSSSQFLVVLFFFFLAFHGTVLFSDSQNTSV